MAAYVAALGRGQGRSRPLTGEEAEDAMTLLLDGAADPIQVGALLMLLRYRGEDPEEIAGLARAASARPAAMKSVKLWALSASLPSVYQAQPLPVPPRTCAMA